MREADSIAVEAAAALADALAIELHRPGARERHRERLATAIEAAERVIESGTSEEASLSARRTLVAAHLARAGDARHGAGQLSRGAQRAPTVEACDDGWERVASIARVAEASAAAVAHHAPASGDKDAAVRIERASAAAREARRIVDDRNHAYTFHADPRFSFGEGWYVAACGVLHAIDIQLRPDGAQTAAARRFLADAGLADRVVPYRPRPRAPKQLTALIARSFRADAAAAQRALRAAFLGAGPVSAPIAAWTADALAGAPAGPRVLLWIRRASHDPERNTAANELAALAQLTIDAGMTPVLFGDAPERAVAGAFDLSLCWRGALFQGETMRRAQLQLFEALRGHGVVGQIGVTTAGMDGPALLGLPTMYLTAEPNVRMGQWVGAVPGYQEIVRDGNHLDRLRATLARWAT